MTEPKQESEAPITTGRTIEAIKRRFDEWARELEQGRGAPTAPASGKKAT